MLSALDITIMNRNYPNNAFPLLIISTILIVFCNTCFVIN